MYVKLQPYQQKTIANMRCLKLFVRFFRLYQVLEKVGKVAYKLELSTGAKVHLVFYVSQLKKHVGAARTQSHLPMLDETGLLIKQPICILDRRLVKKHGQAVTEVLIQWHNTFLEDSTWENFALLQQ